MNKTIGQMVKMGRVNAGLTQKELAHRMGLKVPTSITYVETDKYKPTIEQLHRIAQALDITIDNLLPQEWLSQAALRDMEMSPNEYQKEALRTASGMNKEYPMALNGVLGLAGESGECVDMMKKHLFQGHPLEVEHMAKELGDVAWYLAVTAYAIGYDLETILRMNVEKLRKRYPDGFEVDKSLHRKEGDI